MKKENAGLIAHQCPVTKTIDLMNGRWKPIILFLIQHGYNRFSLMLTQMPLVSKKVLAQQLRDLEKQNLITRQIVVKKHPQVVIYSLTCNGIALRTLIDDIFNWGAENLYNEPDRKLLYHVRDIARQQLNASRPSGCRQD